LLTGEIDFINMMNTKFDNLTFVFHATDDNKNLISEKINYLNLKNIKKDYYVVHSIYVNNTL